MRRRPTEFPHTHRVRASYREDNRTREIECKERLLERHKENMREHE